MCLPTLTTACSAGPAWTRSHRSSSLGIDPVEAGLLQRRPGRPSSINTCTAAAGYARRCSRLCTPLQQVLHAAARVIYDLKSYDHVTLTLKALHWLPVKQRIKFKLCLLVQLVINKRAPVYVQNLLTTTASMSGHASNRSAGNNAIVK